MPTRRHLRARFTDAAPGPVDDPSLPYGGGPEAGDEDRIHTEHLAKARKAGKRLYAPDVAVAEHVAIPSQHQLSDQDEEEAALLMQLLVHRLVLRR